MGSMDMSPLNGPNFGAPTPHNTTKQGVLHVRVWTLIAAVVMGSFAAADVSAQGTANATAAAGRPPIGVVDIGYILKNHPTMKSEMESIQASMEAADKEMAEKRDFIVQQMNKLRDEYVEGTEEYARAEKGIAEQDTEFRLELVRKRKEFEQAQANVLYKVYSEINTYLGYLNDNYGVQVILRVNREKMDPKKPETVQMVMSQDVLYFNPTVDYSQWMLDAMKQQATRAASAGGAAPR
jgi:Skp family chaperone for outer membrane proteins